MSPFEILGLPARFALDRDELERRYRDLQKALHPDRFAQASASERRMSLGKAVEVNEAYRVLRDDLSRAEALLALHGWTKEQIEHERAEPEFLMEIMELREELGEARRDADRVRALAARVTKERTSAISALSAALDVVSESKENLHRAAALLGRLRYFQRFLDEVSAIEDEALS